MMFNYILLLSIFISGIFCQETFPTTTPTLGWQDIGSITVDPECQHGILNESVCCSNICNNCTTCGTELDLWCCDKTILNSDVYCEESIPPCLMYKEGSNEESNESCDDCFWLNFTLLEFIIFVSISSCCAFFILYACCCFGSKKPPLDYNDIVGKFD